jgi:tetratricopeptide (TPR) repeat protein
MKTLIFILLGTAFTLCGCGGSVFRVKSEPLQADVTFKDPKTGEQKTLGKTPFEMPTAELRNQLGDAVGTGEFFTIQVEKSGFIPQSFSVPVSRFGTMLTSLDVTLKEGKGPEEERTAKEILDHLFLAQKLALAQQYERSQIELDKILSQFPKFARALSMRASIYFAQRNFSESLKWYEEALKVDPQMEDAVKMIAKAKALQDGTARTPASTTNSTKRGGR